MTRISNRISILLIMNYISDILFTIYTLLNKYSVYCKYTLYIVNYIHCFLSRGATRGGRPGARLPLASERGGAPPLQNEKERNSKNGKYQYHRIKKTNRVVVEIILKC